MAGKGYYIHCLYTCNIIISVDCCNLNNSPFKTAINVWCLNNNSLKNSLKRNYTDLHFLLYVDMKNE